MRLSIKITVTSLLSLLLFFILMPIHSPDQSVFGELSTGSNPIKMEITSSSNIHAIAGQIITVNGTITNLGSSPVGGIAYISIIDVKAKIPIDLEDWSAHKGIAIDSLAPGQSIPMEWHVRLVKDGSYTVVILFSSNDGSTPPTSSVKTFLEVSPKHSLNPGNVLPVVFGVPALLMTILGAINYGRGRKMGVYR
ncbi:MAG: hypothetical protein KGH81_01155 [Thaumarchaeota archaeon]|nr:hypothetical protein [Nitrososphaerota archaeon]MDE1840606.1 hypothetical protein [Nitrososphaerota archaeon]